MVSASGHLIHCLQLSEMLPQPCIGCVQGLTVTLCEMASKQHHWTKMKCVWLLVVWLVPLMLRPTLIRLLLKVERILDTCIRHSDHWNGFRVAAMVLKGKFALCHANLHQDTLLHATPEQCMQITLGTKHLSNALIHRR